MPYALSAARMAKYRSWFLDPAYTVTALPSFKRRHLIKSVRGVS